MALTTTTDADLGQTLRHWREHAGMSIDEMGVRASDLLPRSRKFGRATVHRYEKGDTPDRGMDPIIVVAITLATGHQVSELPEKMREDFMRIVRLSDPQISSLLDPTSVLALASAS